MGLTYTHYLVTTDDKWIPTKDTMSRILEVLKKWNLVQSEPEIYEIVNRKPVPIKLSDEPQQGMYLYVEDIKGPAVATFMGKSYDPIPDESRSLWGIRVVVGNDFRIHPGGEEFSVEVLTPPLEDGVPLESYCDGYVLGGMHQSVYKSTKSTIPPVTMVDFQREEYVDKDFKGYYRGAIEIKNGKHIPAFADKRPYRMPNRDFVKDMEEAFGCSLGEIGLLG